MAKQTNSEKGRGSNCDVGASKNAVVKIIAAHKMLNRIFACSDITIATSPLFGVLCFDHLKCGKEMGEGTYDFVFLPSFVY